MGLDIYHLRANAAEKGSPFVRGETHHPVVKPAKIRLAWWPASPRHHWASADRGHRVAADI